MISVCITTYNGEKYIKDQIMSIISQLSENDEIIVSDDGSTDSTLHILQSLNIGIMKIVMNDGPKGYTPNFENALRHCSGDYIFLSDQDDVWCPGKISKCMELFKKYDFIISDATVVDRDCNILHSSFWEIRKPYKSLPMNLLKFGFLGCCMAFKRKVLEKALPIPARYDLCTYDNWIFLISAARYKVFFLDEQLIFYRRHGENTSRINKDSSTKTLFRIKYRIYLVYNLIKRIFSRST